MKIERTGGFAGLETLVALYDIADLPAGRAGRVREALDALAAAEARGDEGGDIGADLFVYRITVQDERGGGETRVYKVREDPTAGESSVLEALLRGAAE
ncbi:protealysin inhibitor emfourin [Actinomadura sp. 1N219]|uniref:protealysin inhibitor emfourin n=1 Tax=Actinomadura sp. 1N219 TaxID=3375152 RepID=UPI00378D8AD2